MQDNTLHSYHTFMFPFVIKDKASFEKSIAEKWKDPILFKIKEPRDYNEFNYFYPYIQKILYQRNDDSCTKYFEYQAQSGTYKITCVRGEFSLDVDGISLRLFSTDVGILSFNLKNTQYSNPEDILAINDFGRRIYPAFLGKDGTTTSTKKKFLAQKISLKLDGEADKDEDFSHFDTIESVNVKPESLPTFISELLGENHISSIIDDRMFVLSLCMNDEIATQLKTYEKNDWWYQYLFIDGNGITCQSEKMIQNLLQQSTYDRWLNYGTLFGISRYSFVCATSSLKKLEKNDADFLVSHMQTMYFQMFSLLLAYKASILKFATDVANISKNPSKNLEEIKELHKNYLYFTNNLFFKEITAQDQGIELFDKAMALLNIEKSLKDLNDDIAHLHAFSDLENEKQRQDQLENITKLGSMFLPATLVSGILGMNTIGFIDTSVENIITSFVAIGLSFLGGFLISFKLPNVIKGLMILLMIGGFGCFILGDKCEKIINSFLSNQDRVSISFKLKEENAEATEGSK